MTDRAAPREVASDDHEHYEQALAVGQHDDRVVRMFSAINLLGDALALIPNLPWSDLFANDLGAGVCLTRAYRELRSATTLLLAGYYGQIRVILRSAYESATLARMLAKEPRTADEWLKKMKWFPEKSVRGWAANAHGFSSEQNQAYVDMYRHLGDWAHPSALSCLPYVQLKEHGPELSMDTVFDADTFFVLSAEIAVMAVFACFAVRNAAADERAIDPNWRQRLSELAPVILGQDMSHLERDWDEERHAYRALGERTQSADKIRDHLRTHPLSWDNLRS